jgi:hypothetical protein
MGPGYLASSTQARDAFKVGRLDACFAACLVPSSSIA